MPFRKMDSILSQMPVCLSSFAEDAHDDKLLRVIYPSPKQQTKHEESHQYTHDNCVSHDWRDLPLHHRNIFYMELLKPCVHIQTHHLKA